MASLTFHTQCHCKGASFKFSLPLTALPLSSAFCSCNSCRYATGQLAASFAIISIEPTSLDFDVFCLTRYASSDKRSRYFCPACGASILDFDSTDGRWRACTGALDRTQGLLQRDEIFVGDTVDGGLNIWLTAVGRQFVQGPGTEEAELDSRGAEPPSSTTSVHPDDRLLGKCHCGGVQFYVKPPAERKRYPAALDTCTSCRTTTGFEVTAWAAIPLTQIETPDGMPFRLKGTTLKDYRSSPGMVRYFCCKCGAAVFAKHDDQSYVDVAAGVLKAEEGARAEKWLEWSKDVGYWQEAIDPKLLEALRDGLGVWQSGKSRLQHA